MIITIDYYVIILLCCLLFVILYIILWIYSIYGLFLILNSIILYIIVIQDGWTALMWASASGYLPVVECLVQQGAKINMQNEVRNGISSISSLLLVCIILVAYYFIIIVNI